MPKILFGARRLRFEAQQVTGAKLSVEKAAEGITAKMRELSGGADVEMGRMRLNNYELGKISEVKTLELLGMCAYYSEIVGRTVNTSEIVGYDANNKKAFGQPVLVGL